MGKASGNADGKFSKDASRTGVGDQLPEEQLQDAIPGGGKAPPKGSHRGGAGKKRDSGPKIATGNRRAAGTK